MFNEECLTKKSSFSKKARVAFLFLTRKSTSHAFGVSANFILKFALIGFCMAFVSCANIFQDKVAMSRSGTPATLGDIFVSGAVVGELDAPSQIIVSQYEFKDKIRISWSRVKNARYYTLQRGYVVKDENGEWKNQSESDSIVWETIGQIFGTSWEDKIITGDVNNDDALDYKNKKYGYAYYYSVSAGNRLLGYDDSKEKKSSWGALLPPPSNTKASLGSSEKYVKITWKGTDSAKRYEVYRSSQTDGNNSTRIATLYPNETSYQDNNVSSFKGANLFYTVCAVGENGEKSVASSVAMGYTSRPGAPNGVNNVFVTKGHGENRNSIEIQWEPVNGEGIFYNVYRSDSNDNTMIELATEITVDGTFGTYTDNGSKAKLSQNIYYYYYIQSYKKAMENGEEVIYQGPISVSGPSADLEENSFDKYAEGFILSAPSSVDVQKPSIDRKTDPYKILFTPAIGDKEFKKGSKGSDYNNNYEYIVLGGDSESGTFNRVASATSNSLQIDGDKYSITLNASPCKFYKMQVKYNGEESEQTSAVAPAPYAPTDVYVTCAALVGDASGYQPTSIDSKTESYNSETDRASNSNGVHPVKIVWTEPEGGDAVYYNIYRKTSFTSNNWGTPINEEPIQGTSYVDKNEYGKPDIVYYYSVVSLNSLKQGTNRSTVYKPELIGTGADAIIKTFDVKIGDKVTRCGKGWGWGALSAWQYIQQMCKPIENSHLNCTPLKASNPLDMAKQVDVPGLYGYLHYDATDVGMNSAYADLEYFNYADYYINDDESLGYSFLLNGHTDTDADWSKNGIMKGTVTCKGMYPGSVSYNHIEVKGGDSGGGYYELIREGIDTETLKVFYLAGHDIKFTPRKN